MRLLAAVVVLAPSWAMADRLVDIPLGRKLLRGVARIRLGASLSDRSAAQLLVGTGVLDSYDVDIDLARNGSGPWEGTFDVSYNLSPPITDIAPGISFGVLDVLERTKGGRAGYLAFTQRFGNYGTLNQDTPTELTVGLWSRTQGLFFVGASLPLWDRLLVIGEASGDRLVAGFEARPFDGLSLRWLAEKPGQRLQATLQVRF